MITDLDYVASTQTMTLYAGAPIELTQIVSIFNLTKKRPVYDNNKNNINDLASFSPTASGASFTLTCPYASEFGNLDYFVVTFEDRVNTGVSSSFEMVFEAADDLTTELITDADYLRERSNTGYYLLAVHKPDEATAGDLTINIYNQIWLGLEGTSLTTITVGTGPFSVAVNPAGTKAYVTNYNSGTVSVIDTSSNTVSATITVGTQPRYIAINPAGTKAYVVNFGSGTVSVIDTSSNTVSATITVETHSMGVAVNPAGTKAYVVNFDSGTVSVIDTSSNTVSATITVGSQPRYIAINPAGTKAYVVNFGSGTVSVIDTSSNTVSATITVGIGPHSVAVNPAGTKAYVTNYNSGTVSVIDTSSNTVSATITVGIGPHSVAVNPAGTKAYVVNFDSGTVSVIDTSSNTVSATITVGTQPRYIAINPAGTKAYVTNAGSGAVSVIELMNIFDMLLTSVTVAQVASSATNKCFIIQGAGAGEGTVKLGAKFTNDSGAITVNAIIYAI